MNRIAKKLLLIALSLLVGCGVFWQFNMFYGCCFGLQIHVYGDDAFYLPQCAVHGIDTMGA